MSAMDYTSHFEFLEAVKNNDGEKINPTIDDADFPTKNPYHWTPLHYAAFLNNLEFAKQILDQNKDLLNNEDRDHRTALSIATIRGYPDISALLLESGADLNVGLPLCHAVSGGNVECVEQVINQGANIDEEYFGEQKVTPIIVAVIKNNLEILKSLIQHNANVNYVVHTQLTPIHWACELGWLDGVKELLTAGAEINCRCQYNNTPLDYALLHERSNVIEYLLDNGGIDVNSADTNGSTVLHTAVMTGVAEHVAKLIESGANVNAQDSDQATPLYLTAYNNKIHEEIFESLVAGGADINISASNNWTPLHMCCAVGNIKCVKLLLEKLTDEGINAVTMENMTPLYIAAAQGHVEVCKELLEKGAYMNIRLNDFPNLCSVYPYFINPEKIIKSGRDAVEIAALQDNTKVLELFDQQRKENPDSNVEEIDIINYAKENNLDELNNYSDDINKTDLLGWTCLHHAAALGHYDFVKACIDLGTDVNLGDKYSRTPLTVAAGSGKVNIVELLIESGADTKLDQALFYAIENNQADCINFLLEHGADVGVRDAKKRTPLAYATSKGSSSILEQLISHGADVTVTCEDDDTPLHFAAQGGFIECVELLIKNGGDVNAQNTFKETPLMLAIVSNMVDVVKLLLESGADVNIVNRFKESPLHLASQSGLTECVNEILKYNPDVNAINSDYANPLLDNIDNDIETFRKLIEQGTDLNVTLPGSWTGLHIAACYGAVEFGEELLKHGVDVNALSENGVSPLYIAAAGGHLDYVTMLVEAGCYVDAPINNLDGVWKDKHFFLRNVPLIAGSTPLIAAVCNNHLDIVQYLHTKGASIETTTEAGMTPLMLAVSRSRLYICEYLIDQGCKLDLSQKDNLLDLAKENEQFKQQLDKYLSKLEIKD